MLRCTYCKKTFKTIDTTNLLAVVEFDRCPICGFGYLVGGELELSDDQKCKEKMSRIRKMQEQLDRMSKMLKDDNVGLESEGAHKYNCKFHQPDPHEVVHEVSAWPPVSAKWNLQLSANDIDSQRFTTCTIDTDAAKHIVEDLEPGEITTEVINKMQEIFVNTFGEDSE